MSHPEMAERIIWRDPLEECQEYYRHLARHKFIDGYYEPAEAT